MQAIILVGGYGNRLRPLTLTVPKPLVDFANKPILCHQLEALNKAGVKHVILTINYQETVMQDELKQFEQEYDVKITCIIEQEPMGTAGPIGLARETIRSNKEDESDYFIVLNSDIVCEYQFDKMLEFHESHGKEATLMIKGVEDPSKYGVVVSDESNKVTNFIEKPSQFISNQINTGIYIFSKSLLCKIDAKPSHLETDVLPQLASEGNLYSMPLDGFWKDIGLPINYLIGTQLYLQYLRDTTSDEAANAYSVLDAPQLASGKNVIGNVLIHPSAQVDTKAVVGPNVVIGDKCVIGPGARIANSVILGQTEVKSHAFIRNSIIGWQSIIGHWVRIEGVSVVAQDVQIKDELFINESMILPHRNIQTSIPNAGTIVM